jgi:uncharacterized protein YjdB
VPGGVWSSSNPSIASISGSGLLTGLSSGTSIISYIIGSCYTTSSVNINGSALGAITGSSSLCAFQTITLIRHINRWHLE